jgi:hypothetical protein
MKTTKLYRYHIVVKNHGHIIRSFKSESAAKKFFDKYYRRKGYGATKNAFKLIREWNRTVRP